MQSNNTWGDLTKVIKKTDTLDERIEAAASDNREVIKTYCTQCGEVETFPKDKFKKLKPDICYDCLGAVLFTIKGNN